MISRYLTMSCLLYLVLAATSCGSKKEFVITDDYVNRESGGVKTNGSSSNAKTSNLTETDKKYFAVKLGVQPSEINNDNLYGYIKTQESKAYTGSAAVVDKLYATVYGKRITGAPTDMVADKRLELFKSKENLREGDLVFFRANNNEVVTHVGVYLKNNRFFSCQNNKAGIYNLKKGHWKNNFVTAGRLKL